MIPRSGTTKSGRYFFRYEVDSAEGVFLAHAALTHELGEENRFVKRVGHRLARIIEGFEYSAPLVLRGDLGRIVCVGLHNMETNEHDGFHEVVTEDCGEMQTGDYAHAYTSHAEITEKPALAA